MPKVLIVDDHQQVRSSLRTFFSEEGLSYFVGEAATGQEALDKCRAEPWDVVLLDISMPGVGGLEVLHTLRREYPTLPVLMLSFFLEREHIGQCLAAGAMGYIAKEDIPTELIPAILAARAGLRYLTPNVQALLGQEENKLE